MNFSQPEKVLAATQRKVVCKAALVNLDDAASSLLRDCFKQFRIEALDVTASDSQWVSERKYDACVLRLEPGCETVLEAMRSSPLNRHMVIYGVSLPGQHLRQVSKFGINVMLNHPLERQAVLKIVRATHLLVLHEFRRYVRLPVIAEVQIEMEHSRYPATSVEISGGGMSMQTRHSFKISQVVELSFSLPNSQPLGCAATVSWIDEHESMIGVRFDAADERRSHIKQWIEEYLEI